MDSARDMSSTTVSMRRALVAVSAAIALLVSVPAFAAGAARDAMIERYVAAQSAGTPFLKEQVLPFLVRVALARKLEEAGADGALGTQWTPEAAEWHQLEGRAPEISVRAVESLAPTLSVDEGREILEGVSDEDLDALLSFQQSPLAKRMIKAADYGLSAVLMLSVVQGEIPDELVEQRSALVAELEAHRSDVRLSPEDQAELGRLFQRPAFARVAAANRNRLEKMMASGGGPVQRLNAVLQKEVDATVAAFRLSHPNETPR
jgi:hypothetical protein